MTITRRDGTTRTDRISAVLDDDLRYFFRIPPTAQILFPFVPGFEAYGINFRFTGASFDTQISGPAITQLTPASIRSLLLDSDLEYITDVDGGKVLLRDWRLAQRPRQVRNALDALDTTGQAFSKILKVHGDRDGTHYATIEVEYIQKLIAAGNSDKIRYYFSRNADRFLMGEETFRDSTGAVQSLGWFLDDLDALIAWVERRIEPGMASLVGAALSRWSAPKL